LKISHFTGPKDTILDPYTLFASLQKYDPGSVIDFCQDFGSKESLEALRAWQEYQDNIDFYSIDTLSEYCYIFGYSKLAVSLEDAYQAVKMEYEAYTAFITAVFAEYPNIIKFFDLIA
jgi:hypothetical protein